MGRGGGRQREGENGGAGVQPAGRQCDFICFGSLTANTQFGCNCT